MPAQRAYEFEALAKDFGLMVDVLPTDASCEDIEVDEQLSFLDPFVNDALRRGAMRYVPPTQRLGALDAIKPKHGAAPLAINTGPQPPGPAPLTRLRLCV